MNPSIGLIAVISLYCHAHGRTRYAVFCGDHTSEVCIQARQFTPNSVNNVILSTDVSMAERIIKTLF